MKVRGAEALAATLVARWDDALLFRTLATLRTDAPLPQLTVDEIQWDGTPRAAWVAFTERWGLPRMAARPHRWREG